MYKLLLQEHPSTVVRFAPRNADHLQDFILLQKLPISRKLDLIGRVFFNRIHTAKVRCYWNLYAQHQLA
jgi:hypothetical protein